MTQLNKYQQRKIERAIKLGEFDTTNKQKQSIQQSTKSQRPIFVRG